MAGLSTPLRRFAINSVIEVLNIKGLERWIDAGGLCVILFSGESWCDPCKKFRPHFNKAVNIFDHAEFIHVDVDKADDGLIREYGIQGVPQVHVFNHGQFRGTVKGRTIIKIIPEIEAFND